MKNFKLTYVIIIFLSLLCNQVSAIENRILFKVNNEIITSLDIFNELRYLEVINEQFKNTEKKQALDIAKRSLIREKIKEIELKKVVKEIELEEQFLENVLTSYFRKIKINSISSFENYFDSIGINSNIIKKKITIEILWNQLIFSKYNQSIKIDRQNIINDLKKNNKQKEFKLSEILFNVSETIKLNDKLNLIKNKINESNFSEAALTYSISDTANKGGELGWIKETILNKKIKKIVLNTSIGKYTDPIVIPGGFLILKIENVREVDKNFKLDEEVEKIIKEKTNEQLNQFSNIFFNKIQKDIRINEL